MVNWLVSRDGEVKEIIVITVIKAINRQTQLVWAGMQVGRTKV